LQKIDQAATRQATKDLDMSNGFWRTPEETYGCGKTTRNIERT
jgi:hypothetical protein